MKKNLLSLAVLAGLATSAANAGEFYLIKDGKLQEGVSEIPYGEDDADIAPKMEETTWNGEAVYAIKPVAQYQDARFYIDTEVEFSKYWNVEVEFGFDEEGLSDELIGSKWPAMIFSFVSDTVGGTYGLDAGTTRNYFDVKFKDVAGEFNTEKQFLYAKPYLTGFKQFVLGWQREVSSDFERGPVYIKNLKVTGEGNRPFFSENFNLINSLWTEEKAEIQTYIVENGEVYADEFGENDDIDGYSTGCLPLYSAMNEGASMYHGTLSFKRLYETEGTDGSEFYDTENYHGLVLSKVDGDYGRNGRTFYLVPAAGLENAAGFNLTYACKWNSSAALAEKDFDEDTPDELLGLNVKYAFVDDALEAATCEMFDAFGEDDRLPGSWKEFSADMPNGLNGKKYIAIIFDTPVNFSYVVDNIRLSAVGEGLSMVVSDKPEGDANIACVTGYTFGASQGDVKNVLNDVKVSVYPVPATDVVTVANEGVEKVEVVNAAGSVVASANGNQVNVAAVANGIYVVKAYTAEGILVAKIVKK